MLISNINFLEIEENKEYIDIINKVLKKCFNIEKLKSKKLYVNIILTSPKKIKDFNKQYRSIDKETDVLSFPMFEKEELERIIGDRPDILGDIVISIEQVKKQASEYNHSFKRELSYMVVHGFYHLLGYDHIKEVDKKVMRQKEENILKQLNILK